VIIYTLWHHGDDDDAPWIVDAVDEYTVDENNGFPPEYQKHRDNPRVRELLIEVPEKDVRAIFDSPTVKATIKAAEKDES